MGDMNAKPAAIKKMLALFSQESLLVLLAQLDSRIRSVLTRGIRTPAAASGYKKRVAVAGILSKGEK